MVSLLVASASIVVGHTLWGPVARGQASSAEEQPDTESAAKADVQTPLPSDYQSLSKLKSDLIAKFQTAESSGDTKAGTEVLVTLFDVEAKLLDLAEQELSSQNAEVMDLYRKTPQIDGGMLAHRFYEAGDYKKSVEVYDRVLRIASSRSNQSLTDYSDLIALRLRAKRLANRPADEQTSYQSAIQTQSRAYQELQGLTQDTGEPSPEVAAKLAEILDALKVQERLGGPTPSLATTYGDFAMKHRFFEDFVDAEALFQHALQMLGATIGTENERYATILFNLGTAYRDQERWDEAATAFSRASLIEDRIGVSDKSQLSTLDQLAGVYRQLNQDEKFNQIVVRYRDIEYRSSLGLEGLVKYIPGDAYVAVSMDPAALMRDSSLQQVPRELLTDTLVDAIGVDPMEIQTVVGVLSLPLTPAQVNGCLLIKPIAGATLQPSLPGQYSEVGVDALAYQKRVDQQDPCYATLPDGVFAVGTELAIRQVLAAASKLGEGATASRCLVAQDLVATHGDGDLLVSWDVGKLQSMIAILIEQSPALPAELEPLKSLVTKTSSMHASVSILGNPVLKLRLRPRPESSAAEVHSIIQPAFLFGVNQLRTTVRQQIAADQPELAESLGNYTDRMLQGFYDRSGPQIDGSEVIAQIESFASVQGPALVALLIPAVEGARQAARRTNGSNSLKQVGLAMHNYYDTNGHLPARGSSSSDAAEGLSWRVHVLPFLDEQALYEQFHLDEPWDSEHNAALIEQIPTVFANSGLDLETGKTNLLTIDSPEALILSDSNVKFGEVLDGLSNTILVVEANADRAVIWTKPEDLSYDSAAPMAGLGRARENGFNILWADGRVEFAPSDVSAEEFGKAVTRAGGEVLTWP